MVPAAYAPRPLPTHHSRRSAAARSPQISRPKRIGIHPSALIATPPWLAGSNSVRLSIRCAAFADHRDAHGGDHEVAEHGLDPLVLARETERPQRDDRLAG